MSHKLFFTYCLCFCISQFLIAQESNHGTKFEELGTALPTPNEYRTASGAPGPKYWQQRVDYNITCELDESQLKLFGKETITYYNNSPDPLSYLWLQLDENEHSTVNHANYQKSSQIPGQMSSEYLDRFIDDKADNGYGFNIIKINDINGKSLKHTLNRTMLKVQLPYTLQKGQVFSFKVEWNYKFADRGDYIKFGGARGGYEMFPDDNNAAFTITQWYPRLCVYSDVEGWQNNQFTGRGEFAVQFGNFKVQMTVPADHIVGSTGECLNYAQVLNPTQLQRWQKAQYAKEPVQIVNLEEALKASETKKTTKKTWIFKADNVRDFAWTSSRRFVWDAMPIKINNKKVMCMSYYCKEAYPIYSRFSTKAVAHTIKTYSDFTIPYTYPVAISVEGNQGMEYPMICFNPGRADKDGTYSEGAKNAAIFVIIHEVGHNFFPMIINSDERQWAWMDEGLNSYMQYITQELWDNKFPSDEGAAYTIVDYMKLPKDQLEPIMTNSENILHYGANAYSKVATGLNILRESIMGRELFDQAFKEYCKRWAFKHPTPADFFRSMEDASGEDLDWFWRGWFFTTDVCDMKIETVKYFTPDVDFTPKIKTDTVIMQSLQEPLVNKFEDISKIRNRQDSTIKFSVDKDTTLRDFYWRYARGIEPVDTAQYPYVQKPYAEKLTDAEKLKYADKHAYEISISNLGGLPMPVIIEWTFEDGTKEMDRIPAQVWRLNENYITKAFVKNKAVSSVQLDPMQETADIDLSNNVFGNISAPSKFKLFKQKKTQQNMPPTPMQKAEKRT